MMPQTSPERAAKWTLGDVDEDRPCALAFLKKRDWKETRNGIMRSPGDRWSEEEKDALFYLIEEWDFDYGGCLCRHDA
jgi:hypothetical protein